MRKTSRHTLTSRSSNWFKSGSASKLRLASPARPPGLARLAKLPTDSGGPLPFCCLALLRLLLLLLLVVVDRGAVVAWATTLFRSEL